VISARRGSVSFVYIWNVVAIDAVGTIQLCPDPRGDGALSALIAGRRHSVGRYPCPITGTGAKKDE
jgi:hypothetical protein